METGKAWVDFKQVKQAVTMQMVLAHYQITGLQKKGDELRGACPIHKGASSSSKHFSVNLTKNAFKCFASECNARGNVLDFVAKMEQCTVREAALKLATWFAVGESAPASEQEAAETNHAALAVIGSKLALCQTKLRELTELVEEINSLVADLEEAQHGRQGAQH